MDSREWALIAFTILTQMSVGAFVVLGVLWQYAFRKTGEQEADRLSDRILVAVVAVLGLGIVASLFHLGNPLNAPKAFTNIASSWLSREILLGVVFSAVAILFVGLQWFKVGTSKMRNTVAVVAAVIGIVFVYIQSRVYMISTQPSWNTLATPISFFTTAMLLGVLAIGTAVIANYAFITRKEPGCGDIQCDLLHDALKGVALASIVLVGVQLIVIALNIASLANSSAEALESVHLMVGSFNLGLVLRLVLGFIGAGILGVFLYQTATNQGKEKTLGYLAYSAFILVLIAEVSGRMLFYATQFQIGI